MRSLGSKFKSLVRKSFCIFVFLHSICASSVLASKTHLFLFSILGLMRTWGLNVGGRGAGSSSFLGRMLKACHTFPAFYFLCTGWDPLIALQG